MRKRLSTAARRLCLNVFKILLNARSARRLARRILSEGSKKATHDSLRRTEGPKLWARPQALLIGSLTRKVAPRLTFSALIVPS